MEKQWKSKASVYHPNLPYPQSHNVSVLHEDWDKNLRVPTVDEGGQRFRGWMHLQESMNQCHDICPGTRPCTAMCSMMSSAIICEKSRHAKTEEFTKGGGGFAFATTACTQNNWRQLQISWQNMQNLAWSIVQSEDTHSSHTSVYA